MKLRCIRDSYKKTHGIFRKTTEIKQIEGLTEGKIYEGLPMSIVDGSIGGGTGNVRTEIKFLIFDDLERWKLRDISLFVPVKE